jgi:hypothetical protein
MCNNLPSKIDIGQFMRALILKTAIQLSLSFRIYSCFGYNRQGSIYLFVLAQKLHWCKMGFTLTINMTRQDNGFNHQKKAYVWK